MGGDSTSTLGLEVELKRMFQEAMRSSPGYRPPSNDGHFPLGARTETLQTLFSQPDCWGPGHQGGLARYGLILAARLVPPGLFDCVQDSTSVLPNQAPHVACRCRHWLQVGARCSSGIEQYMRVS